MFFEIYFVHRFGKPNKNFNVVKYDNFSNEVKHYVKEQKDIS